MKKHFTKLLCTLMVPVLILSFGCFTTVSSAADTQNSIPTIVVTDPDYGDISVKRIKNNTAKITLEPCEGYLTSDITLTSEKGKEYDLTSKGNNVYTCKIPKEKTYLNAGFRRTRLVLSEKQLAMDKGDKKKISGELEYIDGTPESRGTVENDKISFSSSDSHVASISCNGKITAKKMGYTRIEAEADAGNNVSSFFYVIVDGDKDVTIGKLGLFAYFNTDDLINRSLFGHSFLVFENTSGKDVEIDVRNLFEINIPKEAFMESYKKYDENGYSFLSYYHPTGGKQASDDNETIREAWAAELYTNLRNPKEKFWNPDNPVETFSCDTYTVNAENGNIATFGNTVHDEDTTEETIDLVLTEGDFGRILRENGLLDDVNRLIEKCKAGEISLQTLLKKIAAVAKEVGYDFNTGYNPLNGDRSTVSGVCLNYELDYQALCRDYSSNTGCSVDITKTQLDAMVDFVQYNNYFESLGRNCTQLAANAWNLVTAYNEDYELSTNLGGITKSIAAPMWLKENIKKKAAKLKKDKNISFYVNGEKSVIQPEILTKDKKVPETGFEKTSFTVNLSDLKTEAQTVELELTEAPDDSVVRYTKVLGSCRLSVSNDGDITVKKGTCRGTYRVKVKATTSEDFDYLGSSLTKIITVKVK